MLIEKNPLLSAIERDDLDALKGCLEQGADVHEQDRYGNTALGLAASLGREEAIRLLVARGAHLHSTAPYQTTGVFSPGFSSLMLAIAHGHEKIAGILLESGVDPLQRSETGETALHASVRKYPALVKRLLARGADPNAQDKLGDTPLMRAASYGNVESVEVLIESGANVNTSGASGDTALHYAAEDGYTQIIGRLLQAGADPQARNSHGERPVEAAKNWPETVRFLQERMK